MDGMVKMNLSFYRNKKVFITGHTGFKGAWLARALVLAGAKVRGYALKPPTKPSLYELAGIGKKVVSATADIRNLKTLSAEVMDFKPEIVFHMAAQPLVRESYENPVYTYHTNVMGTVNLLEACRHTASIKSVVNVTTDKVYQNREHDRGYMEHEILCGYDPYSNSKSCSDILTTGYRNSFFGGKGAPAISTARSGNVIGGGDFSADRILPDCVRAAMKGRPVIIRNPRSTRPYQHVLDCLSGYLLLAKRQYDKKLAGSYNFGPDEDEVVNNGALVDIFCEKWGCGMKSHNKSDGGPHEAKFLKLNCAKAKKMLGWKPAISLEKAVEMTVEWSKVYADKGDMLACMDSQINSYFGKGK